ncbi:unnamed protein product [Ostreobium quekettii]|uniref:Uncharacterized protein n=1 Tax=Ostreobium quekettii TaxID=121088 RepID=A0A8S1JEV5_9CHLO|nr:unnamed protein product [Ostreobium quekettii]
MSMPMPAFRTERQPCSAEGCNDDSQSRLAFITSGHLDISLGEEEPEIPFGTVPSVQLLLLPLCCNSGRLRSGKLGSYDVQTSSLNSRTWHWCCCNDITNIELCMH